MTNNWANDNAVSSSWMQLYFDVVVESCKVGLRKPNHKIYLLACKKLEVQPSEVKIIIIINFIAFLFYRWYSLMIWE